MRRAEATTPDEWLVLSLQSQGRRRAQSFPIPGLTTACRDELNS